MKRFKSMYNKLTLILLFIMPMSLFSQESISYTAKDVLKSMPSDIIPLLTHNNVLDMLDFKEANQKAEVTNRLNGKSELTKLTQTSASIRLTSMSHIDFHLLPKAKDDYLIYMVTTNETSDSLADSEVAVYNSSWQLAGEKHQLHPGSPAHFHSVEIDPSTSRITIQVRKKPLLFEGEEADAYSSFVSEKQGKWDSSQGIFLFSE